MENSRRGFIKTLGTLSVSSWWWPCRLGNTNPEKIILLAGNSGDEKERFRLLKSLMKRPDTSAMLRSDLAKVLPVIDFWANGKEWAETIADPDQSNRYLMRWVSRRHAHLEAAFPEPVAETSPVYPLWCLYRGRLLLYYTIQVSDIRLVEEKRNAHYGEGRILLEHANEAYPDNELIGMYLNRPIPWPTSYSEEKKAPAWANLQREGLEKLSEIIHWWVDHRQLPHGGFGGGWNDDCEMWREWTPILLGFEDAKANQAQQRLARALLSHPDLEQGYTSRMTDVEHSAEETSDVITPMLHINPREPYWQQAAYKILDLATSLWGGVNQRGYWQFKTSYFTVNELDMTPHRTVDTIYHFRLLQPLLLLWQRTRDSQLTDFFTTWLDTWVAVSLGTDKGKPAGVIPTAIHWPEGSAGGMGETWWEPGNYSSPIYNWPNRIDVIATTMLQAYYITGHEKYLQPIRKMVELRKEFLSKGLSDRTVTVPGSPDWVADQLGEKLAAPLAKYRLLAGDGQFDEFLTREAEVYGRFRLTNDWQGLEEGLRFYGQAFRQNRPAYTTEVRHTDRVFAFPDYYLAYFYENVASARTLIRLLYQTVTGDPGSPEYFPMNTVKWKTEPKALAAMVTDASPQHFRARLFHFGESQRMLNAEFYLLTQGKYQLSVTTTRGKRHHTQELIVNGAVTSATFPLLSQREMILKIEKMPDRTR